MKSHHFKKFLKPEVNLNKIPLANKLVGEWEKKSMQDLVKQLPKETILRLIEVCNEELDNKYGMRQIEKGYKSVGLSLLLTEEVLLRSIKNLGYTLIQESDHLAKPTNPVKLLIFKRA